MAVLGIEEIEELLDEIRMRILIANREDRLDQLLVSMGMSDLVEVQPQSGNKDGIIVVLGAAEVDEHRLLGVAKSLGLDKDRFEFCLDYETLQKYNFRKLQYSDRYRLIMVGPMPHSSAGKGDSSSAIAEMEKHPEMYPRVFRMSTGNELKITKTGFKETLGRLIQEGYIDLT